MKFSDIYKRAKANPLASLLIIFLAVIVLLRIISPAPPHTGRDSLGVDPSGYRGLYELLQESGFTTSRWKRNPFIELPSNSLLLFLNPGPALLSEEAAGRYKKWIEEGGTAIFVFDQHPASYINLLKVVSEPAAEFEWFTDEERRVGTEGKANKITAHFTSDLRLKDYAGDPLIYFKTLPSPLKRVLSVRGKPVGIRAKIGKGECWIFTDSSWLTNENLAKGDNAPIFVTILDKAAGERHIIVEEFSHGHLAHESLMKAAASGSGRYFFISMIVMLIIFLWWKFPRFGIGRKEPAGAAPSRRIFVESISRLYKKSSDPYKAMEMLAGHYQSDFASILRVPAKGLKRRLGEVSGLSKGAIDALLRVKTKKKSRIDQFKKLENIRRRISNVRNLAKIV